MPLRLLHFADLHLGVETHGTFRPELGHSSRVQDFLDSFDQIIEAALAEPVDAVLFAGDAFKNADPSPTLQRHFASRIQRLLAAGIPIVLLVGNHDRPRTLTRSTPMDIYAALRLPGVRVANAIELITLETRSGPLQVVTLPWIPASALSVKDDLRNASPAELERQFKEMIGRAVRGCLDRLDPAAPAVFLGHLSMEGGHFGFERNASLGTDPLFALDELGLDRAPLDYVALGHLHSHQVLHHRPPVVYAGSVERIDFGEEHEEKGFVLVTIEDGSHPRRTDWEFRPLRTRPMRSLRFTLASEVPMDELRRVLERRAADLANAIVRLSLHVPSERTSAIRVNEVRRWLLELGAAYVAGIVLETERSSRARVNLSRDARHDPVALLEQWVRLQQLPDDFARAVVAHGRELIARADGGETPGNREPGQR
ncbi:MAG: exonuclease SbcCD subunit D [Thermomicrobium sp.]|nr:exonuclease SbcCD subunit D [Thermomicrobium sp.]MDW8059817.1 exonuclease SbcCD subunit D [Thermomicrobium sp.]